MAALKPHKSSTADLLEQLAREGARQMIQKALLAECDAYLGRGWYERSDEAFRGHRNGQGNERSITLGSGTVKVRVPRVADTPADQPKFQSVVLAAYQRRSSTVAALIPGLWVEGLATRDFEPALRTMLGEDAALSASTVSRLNAELKAEFDVWRDRRLDGTRYA
ncbi:MAG: transposase [Candidatus Sericytochromatia bacterium]|nr:transposase [Candidatus Sericytochromatia bacterium]